MRIVLREKIQFMLKNDIIKNLKYQSKNFKIFFILTRCAVFGWWNTGG